MRVSTVWLPQLMTITATIDRFERDVAVLLVGSEKTVVNVARSDLPAEARQGDVLKLEVAVDQEETANRREEVREKIERLKRRGEGT